MKQFLHLALNTGSKYTTGEGVYTKGSFTIHIHLKLPLPGNNRENCNSGQWDYNFKSFKS